MAAFSVQELVRATEGALVSGDLGVPVAGVSIDSRTLQVGGRSSRSSATG